MQPTASWVNASWVNAGARLDRLPLGSFHRRVLLLIGTGMFVDACDIYLAAGVLGALVKSGWSDVATNATFLFATFTGMLVGTLASGIIGDRFGRRFSYQANLLVFAIASLAAACAPNMQVLIALRFIMGIGLGAEIVVGYSSVAEFMPRASRGRMVALLATITNMAVVVVGFGGLWIIPTIGWRYMFAIIGVAALGVWVARKNMPESPRWLESRGRLDEADTLLRAIEAEASRTAPLPPIQPTVETQVDAGRLRELVSPALIGSTIVGMTIAIVSGLSLYGFLVWVPTFLVKQGESVASSLYFSAMMGLGAPLGALFGATVAERFNRKHLLIALSLAEAALGGIYPMVANGTELMLVGFGLTLCAYALVAIGYGLYIPELFPTRLRLRGAGLSIGVGRLTSAFVQPVIIAIYGAMNVAGVAGFLVCGVLIQVAAVAFLGRETRNRSLEEIAAGPAEPIGLSTPARAPGE